MPKKPSHACAVRPSDDGVPIVSKKKSVGAIELMKRDSLMRYAFCSSIEDIHKSVQINDFTVGERCCQMLWFWIVTVTSWFWCCKYLVMRSIVAVHVAEPALYKVSQLFNFEQNLPYSFGVWFEEAASCRTRHACDWHPIPFARVGSWFLGTACVVVWALVESWLHGFDVSRFAVILPTLMYHGSCTHRMLRYTRTVYSNRLTRFTRGQLCPKYEHDMRTGYITYLQIFENAGSWDMSYVSAELKWVYTTVLLDGSDKVLDFVGRRLFAETSAHPVPFALQDDGENCTPLHEQWFRLVLMEDCCNTLLNRPDLAGASDRRASKENVRRGLVTVEEKRQQFTTIIRHVMGVDFSYETEAAALLAADRCVWRHRNGKRGFQSKRNKHRPTSFAAMLQLLPKVGEKGKVAFEKVTQSGAADTGTEAGPEFGDYSSSNNDDMECIACFEEKAELVFPKCGHLAYCIACGAKARERQNCTSSRSGDGRGFFCPLCRQQSCPVELCSFKSPVYRC